MARMLANTYQIIALQYIDKELQYCAIIRKNVFQFKGIPYRCIPRKTISVYRRVFQCKMKLIASQFF